MRPYKLYSSHEYWSSRGLHSDKNQNQKPLKQIQLDAEMSPPGNVLNLNSKALLLPKGKFIDTISSSQVSNFAIRGWCPTQVSGAPQRLMVHNVAMYC